MKSFKFVYEKNFDIADNYLDNFNYLNDNKDILLYYCGNVLNCSDIKQKLLDKGYKLNSNSEEELIIKLYQEFNIDFIKLIEGEFAFCILDFKQNKVFAFKSLMSTTQLYYSLVKNKLIISTTLKEILSLRKNTINNYALELYMNLRFIPSPHTIIEDVFKLENGHAIVFDGDKVSKMQLYNITPFDSKNNNIKDVGRYVVDSVNKSSKHTKGSGIFLSGGFDSAIIASILAKNNKPIKAFSVGYEIDTKFDETNVAKNIARDLNLEHLIYKIKNSELLNLLNESIDILEEPFYSTVSVSTLRLAKESSKLVQNIYSGDGSDELFYGYKYLRDALKEDDTLNYYVAGLSWLKELKAKDLLCKSELTNEDVHKMLFNQFEINSKAQLLRVVEMFKRFPDYHLFRLGKILSKYNLKSTLPFTEREVIQFALDVDGKSIMNDNDPKINLKSSLEEYLTKDIKESKKQPFTAPNKEWIEGPLKEDLVKVFNNKKLFQVLGLQQNVCLKILNDYQGQYKDVSNIWGIYMLLKWCERFEKYITKEVNDEKK